MATTLALILAAVTGLPPAAPSTPPVRVARELVALHGVRDLDGDGAPDLALRTVRASSVSELIAVSAATGNTLWIAHAPAGFDERSAEPACEALCALSDVDGDGTGDLAVLWRRAEPLTSAHTAMVCFHSGRTGERLLDAPLGAAASELPGTGLVATGDLDGDLRRDVLVLAPRLDVHPGEVIALSGTTGERLWRVPSDARWCANGTPITPLRDVDGDGTADLAAVTDAAIEIRSGRDGRIVRTIAGDALGLAGEPGQDWCLSAQVIATGDLDGDGQQDVCVPVFDRSGNGTALARYSTGAGVRIDRVPLGVWHHELYGTGLRAGGDLDGDGMPDLIVADPFWNLPGVPRLPVADAGAVRIVSARDASVLRAWTGGRCSMWIGARVAPAGDVDRDGVQDVWMSSFETCGRTGPQVGLGSGRTGEFVRWIDLGRLEIEAAPLAMGIAR